MGLHYSYFNIAGDTANSIFDADGYSKFDEV